MREYKKILLAVDITEGSEKIAERARDVAERYGAEVILLHVVEYVPVEPMGEALLPAVQIEGELIERATRRIAELAQKTGLEKAERIVQAGNIKAELVRIATDRGVERVQYVPGVCLVENAGSRWLCQRHVQELDAGARPARRVKVRQIELAGAARSRAAEQGAVTDQDDTAASRCGVEQLGAEIRADACRFAGRDGDGAQRRRTARSARGAHIRYSTNASSRSRRSQISVSSSARASRSWLTQRLRVMSSVAS